MGFNLYLYYKHKNEDAITTRVLLFGLIGTITHLMNYTKRQLLHTYHSIEILTCLLTITIVIINNNNDSDTYSLVFIIMGYILLILDNILYFKVISKIMLNDANEDKLYLLNLC